MLKFKSVSSGNDTARRRGAFMVVAVVALAGTMAFVAFSIDTGHIALHKTLMQNAVDAAALAAAMEITNAVENAPIEETDPTAYAKEQAKIVAADTAQANGVYVDPSIDVIFGLRSYNPATQKFEIQWGAEPANAVKVKARRDNDDTSAPDGKLPMMFAGVLGDDSVQMGAEATAYIESRDISVVLDFSGSMAYDSEFRSESIDRLGVEAIRNNLRQAYAELGLEDGQLGTLDHTNPDDPTSSLTPDVKYLTVHGQPQDASDPQIDVTFKYNQASVTSDQAFKKVILLYDNGRTQSLTGLNDTSGTYQGTGSNSNRNITGVRVTVNAPGPDYVEEFTDNNDAVKQYFQLAGVDYPYPSGSWDDYIDYVRTNSDINRGEHREMYGGITFVHYLLVRQPTHAETPALARTSHYPFHAVRKGNELFVDFLETLGFGDHVGLVSYDQYARQETVLNEDNIAIDLSDSPIGNHYDEIKTIMQHKQADCYYPRTNIGGGLRQGRQQIADHGRPGARPTILLMTDGNANVYENSDGQNSQQWGFSNDGFYQMPSDFDWGMFDELTTTVQQPFYITDDGSENSRARIYALSQAWQAAKEGTTVHTLTVGAGADTDLMKAIAFVGGGEFIEVNGALSVQALVEETQAGFYRIAALVPPARISAPDDGTP